MYHSDYLHNIYSLTIRLYSFLFFKLRECVCLSLTLIQATSNEIIFNITCRRSTIPMQSKYSSQIMCLPDNKEDNPHNPQKQFITLNAAEKEQLLKV